MLPRTRVMLTVGAAALLLIAAGCDISVLYGDDGYGHYDPPPAADPELLAVTSPAGESFAAGDTVEIAWTGSFQPDTLTIDLYLADSLAMSVVRNLPNDGAYPWEIPVDFTVDTEVFDEYRIVVSGYHPDQATGELELVAYSEEFTIVPAASGGLSDVTVSQRLIDVTLVDNGNEIDGDTVDVYLNGSLVVAGHVLAADPGTTFPLTLSAGENVFEIYAVNEGSVSPNTALLEISSVVEGSTEQQWRLATGETGRLTITAP